jgi:hypothetical protein
LWQQADAFARATHESLDLKETAYIVANEGRRLIGCDRVSVAIKKGRKCTVAAVSGQDTIENRSNIIVALNNLATRVVAAGEPLWHDGTTEDLPPQIEEALEDYVDQSYGRNIAVLPLREPERRLGTDQATGAAGEIDRDNAHRGEVIGALIVEQIESNIPTEIFRSRCDLVYEHGTRAIANSQAHTNLFLMPVWRALGHATWVLRARTLPKTLAVAGLVVAVILGLTFIKKDFNLEADGTLLPEARHEIFAPIDGEVIDVLVDHNVPVQKGQVMVRLRNREMEIQMAEIEGQVLTTLADKARVEGQYRYREQLKPSEKLAVESELNELRIKHQVLLRKQALLKTRLDELQIRAPIDGVVVSWDVEKMLRQRPIMTGQVMLEVADLTKPLFLELELPEKREGHLDEYMFNENLLAPEDQLDVTYILATDPDVDLQAVLKVSSISKRADAHDEHGAVIKMHAIPEQVTLRAMNPRPGAKVIAKIYCGRRSSGFVFFHEIIEWCHKFFF